MATSANLAKLAHFLWQKVLRISSVGKRSSLVRWFVERTSEQARQSSLATGSLPVRPLANLLPACQWLLQIVSVRCLLLLPTIIIQRQWQLQRRRRRQKFSSSPGPLTCTFHSADSTKLNPTQLSLTQFEHQNTNQN